MAEISDEEYLVQHPEHRELDPNIRAQIRQNAQLTADLEAERAARLESEKRSTFAEAGLSEHPARELLERAYEVGMTADQLKEQATKYGLLQGGDAGTSAPDNRADLEAIRRTQQASQGAPTGAPMDFGDALDRARSQEEWSAVMAQAPPESGIRLKGTADGYRIV